MTYRPGSFAIVLSFLAMLVWLPAMAPCQEDNQAPAAEQGLEPGSEDKTADEASDWQTDIDGFFGDYLVTPLHKVLFFDFWSPQWLRTEILDEVACSNEECRHQFVTAEEWPAGDVPMVLECPECQSKTPTGVSVPLVVVWLFLGAIFFTLRMGFINVRSFLHGVRLIRGDYDNPEETGEVSHFQALASALSATIGLGNIAGVAIAVGVGGPGAIFWMILAGVIGMSSKFAECTLSQMYRKVSPDGTVSGGPMHYLHAGLKDLRPDSVWLGSLGRVLAVVFAVLCVGASFGGGCAFQVGQSLDAIRKDVSWLHDYPWVYGVIMAFMVGIVIIGGIRRIAATAEKIVPLMCCVYVVTIIYILLSNFDQIGGAFGQIFAGAFTPDAGLGGILGVMVVGMQRAAFSNEAGVGSAAIAHAAAKTEEPIREGIVASLGPFIDTVVICTMTGLAIIVTDVTNPDRQMGADVVAQVTEVADANGVDAETAGDEEEKEEKEKSGAALTVEAFRTAGDWFPYILYVAVVLFAYSTMISWSYYGERCWSHLFGARTSLIYKLLFLVFVVLGSIVTTGKILDFSDLMILAMAFPNILGVALLSGKIRRRLDDYWKRYKSGEMEPNRNR